MRSRESAQKAARVRGCAAAVPILLAACSASQPPVVIREPVPFVAETGADEDWSADRVRDRARRLVHQAERHRVEELDRRSLTHRSLWEHLGPVVDSAAGTTRMEIGRSVEGRTLYAVDFGHGPVRVVLWSQMHGDEPTATLALADLIRYVVENADDPLVARLHERLTVVAIPMLNPDGAQRGRRENARGIDVNRDARRQVTPEARALAGVHARLSPHFGFNLHDQAPRVGEDGRSVAISLLAPPHEPNRSDMPTRTRAKLLAAVMRVAADSLVDGRVTRYDDAFNGQAFGDAMQSWGTSTVLVETGSWEGDADKEYLRQVNFVLLLVALDAIATGSFEHADVHEYDSLPGNRANNGTKPGAGAGPLAVRGTGPAPARTRVP